MVKLEEVEDETFVEKPDVTKDGALLVDDDDDYTDTDSEISDSSDLTPANDETIVDRILALRDIIPPKTRVRISNISHSVYSATNTGLTYGGKGLWVLATSVLLLGIPYALAFGEEQQIMEEQRQQGLMAEGAQGIMQAGDDNKEAKPSL